MRSFIAIAAVFLFSQHANAQTVKLISASHQSWSGGVAGNRGDRYGFTIEFSHYKTEPAPDTLWIGDRPIAMQKASDPTEYGHNVKVLRAKGTIQFQVNTNISHNESEEMHEPPTDLPQSALPHPPIKYKGVALLSYHYNGKRHYYTINKITKESPAANYP